MIEVYTDLRERAHQGNAGAIVELMRIAMNGRGFVAVLAAETLGEIGIAVVRDRIPVASEEVAAVGA